MLITCSPGRSARTQCIVFTYCIIIIIIIILSIPQPEIILRVTCALDEQSRSNLDNRTTLRGSVGTIQHVCRYLGQGSWPDTCTNNYPYCMHCRITTATQHLGSFWKPVECCIQCMECKTNECHLVLHVTSVVDS